MGNTFSNRNTTKDKLIALESQVMKEEYELNELTNSSSIYAIIIHSFFIIPIFCYISFVLEINTFGCITMNTLVLVGWYFLYDLIQVKRKIHKKLKLENLKKERKALIDACKSDVNFTMTKNLIDKYEDEENRNTFFNQIIKKKRSPMEKASDFVLGNDPSHLNALICTKCGVHNGLVDPKNEEFENYYCFSCKHKNIRRTK